jgi:hypothetical protein
MGRGRAKAKQTKVARDLKYNSGGTDLERLKAELAGGSTTPVAAPADDDEDDFDDPYAPDEGDADEDDRAAK